MHFPKICQINTYVLTWSPLGERQINQMKPKPINQMKQKPIDQMNQNQINA